MDFLSIVIHLYFIFQKFIQNSLLPPPKNLIK